MTTEPKQILEIDGVVLTPQLIQTLRNLQESDNDLLHDSTSRIADAVCMLVKMRDSVDEYILKEYHLLLTDLTLIRDRMKLLAKP